MEPNPRGASDSTVQTSARRSPEAFKAIHGEGAPATGAPVTPTTTFPYCTLDSGDSITDAETVAFDSLSATCTSVSNLPPRFQSPGSQALISEASTFCRMRLDDSSARVPTVNVADAERPAPSAKVAY